MMSMSFIWLNILLCKGRKLCRLRIKRLCEETNNEEHSNSPGEEECM